jgi:subtilisin family serine protease
MSPIRSRRLFAVPVLAVLVGMLGSSGSYASSGRAAGTRLLVKFTPGVSSSAETAAFADAGVRPISTIADLGVRVVSVPSRSAAAALGDLQRNRAVSYAEPDSVVKPQEDLPNDPYFLNSGAWNLGGGAWGWYVTHTTQAWDVTKGSPSVVIAILDTGIKANGLADFGGQISSTWNVLNNTTDATTNAGNHGTYVAGVAGLAIGNGVGNAGYCPNCRLMVVQVGTDSGANLSDLASGLTYAADHGARIANMSWAGSSNSSTLQSAINYAHNKGMVIFAAAGNSNCDCASFPAADQNVLGVAGVSDAAGDKQGDSNYGTWVKVAAPEGDMTAWPTINGAPGYAAVGGTSVASPAAAGIAGLLFSYNPALTNTQVEQALEASAAPVRFTIGFGRVDALAALQYLGAGDPQPPSAPVQTDPAQIYYELNGWTSIAPLTVAPQVGQVLVRGVGGWIGSSGLVVNGLQWQRCDPSGAACVFLASTGTYTVQSADSGYTIKLVFTVQNGFGSVPVAIVTQPVGGVSATASPPLNTSAPTISGTPQDGQTLVASAGTWSGATAYAYQWLRCDSTGASCAQVSAATSSSYVVQTADVGWTLAVSVTASNTAGATSAVSAPTALVTSAPAPSPTTQTQSFSGSLTARNPSKSFGVTIGTGAATAQLSFSKCSTLSLAVDGAAGSVIGSTSGPSVVTLVSNLSAGSYTYVVSGGRCSFTLVVTSPNP